MRFAKSGPINFEGPFLTLDRAFRVAESSQRGRKVVKPDSDAGGRLHDGMLVNLERATIEGKRLDSPAHDFQKSREGVNCNPRPWMRATALSLLDRQDFLKNRPGRHQASG